MSIYLYTVINKSKLYYLDMDLNSLYNGFKPPLFEFLGYPGHNK